MKGGAMGDKQIRIYPKRREVDTERLAMALLDLIAKLDSEERARFLAAGEKASKKLGFGRKPKGSAA
jgi:hypothetical protein